MRKKGRDLHCQRVRLQLGLPPYFHCFCISTATTSTRSSSSRSAPPPKRSGSSSTRSSVPAAAPASAVAPQPSQGPGLFANMASTAAGVAVGSTIGHTMGAGISNMFGWNGSKEQPAEYQEPQAQQSQQVFACEPDQKALFKCLETNKNDISACQFYLDMVNQCQAASKSM